MYKKITTDISAYCINIKCIDFNKEVKTWYKDSTDASNYKCYCLKCKEVLDINRKEINVKS